MLTIYNIDVSPSSPSEPEFFSELPTLQPFNSLGTGIDGPFSSMIWLLHKNKLMLQSYINSPEGTNKANRMGAAVYQEAKTPPLGCPCDEGGFWITTSQLETAAEWAIRWV
jgi:hypothetical protein